MKNSQLPRLYVAPVLNAEEQIRITELVFYAPSPLPSDAMIIFGAPEGDWSAAAQAYHDGLVKLIVTSGRANERTYGVPEAFLIRDELISQGVPAEAIVSDTVSTNTLENVLQFKVELEKRKIRPRTILFLTNYHHSGRCYLTIKQYFPSAIITALGHGLLFSGLDIRRNTWTTVEGASERVYGEYQRIIAYSGKGDIADPNLILDDV